ncbi:MAG: penicillin-binding protein 2, penicillin-binding protein 2 [Candidatus Magasanikbacteria bacterium]|nr:penicillin-binding protein 2, penicillin-binding protein 2 [Candidatus Magasanikbacteria bacterium]
MPPILPKFDYSPDFKLTGKYRFDWVQNVAPPDATAPMISASPRSFLGLSLGSKQILTLLIIIAIGFAALLGRLIYLQTVKGGYFLAAAEQNRIRIVPIPAERGIITDRMGVSLVENIPNFSIVLAPQDLPRHKEERSAIIKDISEELNDSPERIEGLVQDYQAYRFDSLILKDNVTYEEALKVILSGKSIPGLRVERGMRRQYPGTSASSSTRAVALSHILGYLGKVTKDELNDLKASGYLPTDTIGRVGVEASYEKFLRGVYGRRYIEVNARGEELNTVAEDLPTPGATVALTIDLDAQIALETALNRVLTANHKKRGSAIAMDPRNGQIIAIVSLPAFDNNEFARGISAEEYDRLLNDENTPLFSRAVGGAFPSGSVIKPLVAVGALAEGIITRETSFLSVGGIQVGPWFFSDWKAGGHGITNVTKALAQSVNTFFYMIGGGYEKFTGLGIERLTKYYKLFGLSVATGIDLPGETSGFIPSKEWKEKKKGERWYIGDTYNVSIGQGDVLVTPLQMADATAAIANGGVLLKPKIGMTIKPPQGPAQNIPAEVIRHMPFGVGPLQIVREGMRLAVQDGSARSLNTLPIHVAGKTGTAQWSDKHPTHAWFTGFAPYENPQIVVTVMIEEGGEGSAVAVPVVKEFLLWWAAHRGAWHRFAAVVSLSIRSTILLNVCY